jgi:hydrogenase maturation protease
MNGYPVECVIRRDRTMVRTIVVGIGNPILGDDAVGIHVARELVPFRKELDIDIEEAYTGGLNLLEMIVGYDRAVLVDSICQPEKRIGKVMVLDPAKIPSAHSTNPHDVSFPEALEMAKRIEGYKIPDEIKLVAINIERCVDFTTDLSEDVKKAIPKALEKVKGILES